jgi:hypothetical protein
MPQAVCEDESHAVLCGHAMLHTGYAARSHTAPLFVLLLPHASPSVYEDVSHVCPFTQRYTKETLFTPHRNPLLLLLFQNPIYRLYEDESHVHIVMVCPNMPRSTSSKEYCSHLDVAACFRLCMRMRAMCTS